MKPFILCVALLSTAAFSAEAPDAGAGTRIVVADIVITANADAGVSVTVDAGVVVDVVPSLDHPLTSAKGFYEAVRTGNGWLAAMFLLFFVVGLIRLVGKRLHAMISDTTTNPLLKGTQMILRFIFDTRIGGWLLNWMSAVGGCLSTAALAGSPVDSTAWKISIMASTGGTALIELKDDILQWWDERSIRLKAELATKLAAAEAAAAAVVAAAAPTPPMPGVVVVPVAVVAAPAESTTPPAIPPVTPTEPPKAS